VDNNNSKNNDGNNDGNNIGDFWYDRCAIVGNSGILHAGHLGGAINDYDLVLRLNQVNHLY
jgi:hypothetical protein